jgi:hypothetical protein
MSRAIVCDLDHSARPSAVTERADRCRDILTRGIPTARGKTWTAMQVSNVLARAGVMPPTRGYPHP